MLEYGSFASHIFQYEDKIEDSVLIWANACQAKPVFWHFLRGVKSVRFQKYN